MDRRILITGITALVFLLSGSAGAQTRQWVALLQTEPVAIHGYRMTMTVYHRSGGDSLGVEFVRSRLPGLERDSYGFLKHVRFTPRANLSSARVMANLGSSGRVVLTFNGRPAAQGGLLPGCTGDVRGVSQGLLRGTFAFATGSRYFGTLRKHTLRATLSRVEGLRCRRPREPQPRPPGGVTLSASSGGGSVSFVVSKPKHGKAAAAFEIDEALPSLHVALFDAYFSHTLFTAVRRRDFTARRDLGAARFVGTTSFLRGGVRFRATGGHVGYGRPGIETGTLEAHFDSIGTFRLFARGPLSGAWLDRF